MSTKRVIGYARLSDATDESTSIARQVELIRTTAAQRHWALVGIIEDPSISASKMRLNRPGIQELRRRHVAGDFDAVLVWRLDRIARSVVDFGTLLDEGMAIVSCTEPLDTTTPMGRAMAEILQVFASMEASAISARTKASVDYLRRNQRFAGGPPPFGYRSAPNPEGPGRVLELDPATAPVVREATERILHGESMYSVARDFAERRLPTPRPGSAWQPSHLRPILLGDPVLGRVTIQGELLRGEDGIPLEVWPAILTVEESQRLRAMFPGGKHQGRRRKQSRLLSGLVVCGLCGGNLTVQNGKSPHPYYYHTPQRNSWECPQPVSVTAKRAEKHVVAEFLKVAGRLEVVESVVIAEEPAELALVEEAIQATAASMGRPNANLDVLVERLRELTAKREELSGRSSEPVVHMKRTGKTFEQVWAEAEDDIARQRSLLESALDEVIVHPAEFAGKWDPDRIALIWKL